MSEQKIEKNMEKLLYILSVSRFTTQSLVHRIVTELRLHSQNIAPLFSKSRISFSKMPSQELLLLAAEEKTS